MQNNVNNRKVTVNWIIFERLYFSQKMKWWWKWKSILQRINVPYQSRSRLDISTMESDQKHVTLKFVPTSLKPLNWVSTRLKQRWDGNEKNLRVWLACLLIIFLLFFLIKPGNGKWLNSVQLFLKTLWTGTAFFNDNGYNGSISWSSLFKNFINDIFNFFEKTETCNYADDNSVYACDVSKKRSS